MHDPNILAFEIKYPWRRHKPWPKKFRHSRERKWTFEHRMTEAQRKGRDLHWDEGYRDTFISVWHKDPELDGSDDSCGWSYPKLTNWQKERLWNGAWSEGQYRHFLSCEGKEWEGTYTEAVSLYEGMTWLVIRLLKLRLTITDAHRYAIERIHDADCCPGVNAFCFLPGYHTNSNTDKADDRQEHFYGILCGIAKCLLSEIRPWWKHPKWHFWHWRFQIHPWQTFKRMFIDRCCKCGKGFSRRESVYGDWNGTRIWHERCQKTIDMPKKEAHLPAVNSDSGVN